VIIQSDPFFSNDPGGWAKVAGLLGAIILGIWRLMNAPFNARIDALTTEIETSKRRREMVDSRLNALERDTLVMGANLRGLDESFGDISADLKRLIDRIDKREDRVADTLTSMGERLASMESSMRDLTNQGRK
jgi:flagellar capping protein FliD